MCSPRIVRVDEYAGGGDTFTYDPKWASEQARDVWVVDPPCLMVVGCDGSWMLGTAHMGPDRPGPTWRRLPSIGAPPRLLVAEIRREEARPSDHYG